MTALRNGHSAQRLAELLARISSFRSPASAASAAIEIAMDLAEAEAGAVTLRSGVIAGRTTSDALAQNLLEAGATSELVRIPRFGDAYLLRAALDQEEAELVVARREGPFGAQEAELVNGIGRVLALTLRMLRAIDEERQHRLQSEEQVALTEHLIESLQEQRALLERLTKIQRSISHRAPLQEVLDAITDGARELLRDDVSGMRLIDATDPTQVVLVSASGIPDESLEELRRGPIDEGVGGIAITGERLAILADYKNDPSGLAPFVRTGLQAAIAAPVYEDGKIAGSLTVGSYKAGRFYSEDEQEALQSFAEHASLALTDARTVEAMREAQRAKDMFFAMASHELKTPLAVILVALHTLEKHEENVPPDVRQRMLGAAGQRVRELATLIDHLLQGARAELATKKEAVPLASLLEKTVEGLDGTRTIEKHVTDTVTYTDPQAVRHAVGILVENAIAHSDDSSTIRVEGRVSDGEVCIAVLNEGSLPEGLDRQTLFSPFQRGPATESSGVGLGLYIAARLAGAVGGRIEVGSADGWVSFSLILPHEQPKSEPAEQDPPLSQA